MLYTALMVSLGVAEECPFNYVERGMAKKKEVG